MKQLLIISPAPELIRALQSNPSRVKTLGLAVVLRDYPPPGRLRSLLGNKRPTAAIIGLRQPDRALALIEEFRETFPEITVAAAHTFNSAELILGSLRAGASEYLGPPFETQHLEHRLTQQPVGDAGGPVRGRLIGFLPARGSSGASTVAIHAAVAMARESARKVLLVDFDFHSGTVDFRLGLNPKFTFAHALRCGESLDEIWKQLTCPWKGIDVLASPRESTGQAQELERSAEVFASARKAYEWVIADMPAAFYASCRDVLVQAEAVYIVCTPELVSLHQARRMGEQLLALGLARETVRLVVNRLSTRDCLSVEEVGKLVGIPVAWAMPNEYEAVSQASMKGRLVADDSELGRQFPGFARQIMGLPEPPEEQAQAFNWRRLFSSLSAKVFPPSLLSPRPA